LSRKSAVSIARTRFTVSGWPASVRIGPGHRSPLFVGSPIPLSRDGFPGAAADLPRSTRRGSASKLRPLGFAFAVIAPAAAH
jgi:hypothetical protein